MESANRDEAEKCIKRGRAALKSGRLEFALKLALKSLKLCSTPEGIEFLDHVERYTDASSKNASQFVEVEDTHVEEQSNTSDCNMEERETYSPEQEEAVKRVLRCTNYYEVLSVPRDVADIDLKKQYKHLALALHPDKNRAPRSEDAFKAISKAYATLSDPSRRNHYDRFGEDGLHAFPPTAGSPDSPDDYLRFVFSDGDDFFRFFDNNGFMGRDVFMRNTHGSSRRFRTHYRRQRQDENQSQNLWQVQIIMLVIFGSVFISLMSSIFTSSPLFSLRRNSDYSEKRVVPKYNIPYFVKVGFNQKDVPNVEKEVVEQYVWELKEQCRSDRYWGVGARSKACSRLREVYGVQNSRG